MNMLLSEKKIKFVKELIKTKELVDPEIKDYIDDFIEIIKVKTQIILSKVEA